MLLRKRLLAGALAAMFAFGAVACEVDEGTDDPGAEDPLMEDDPLEDDPLEDDAGDG